jgi:serine/threonine protein kinase/Flp pilus assembly protein TadD
LTLLAFIGILFLHTLEGKAMGIQCPKCHTDNPDTARFCSYCATPLPSQGVSVTKTLETPTRKLALGSVYAERYEILENLGKGGMGEVYKVRDKKLDEEMALKVLKPEIAANKDMIVRFKNELKLARKIAHRHVCRMYDLNEEEGTPYITMEYVKGEDLKSSIRKKGKLSEKLAVAVARQVCQGLAEAHELGVVHRDLKPQNIMIDESGHAKVMDFGIARSIEAAGMTQTGVMIGTPDYMSPEQAEGEEADQRSDIYALGVILYEMVTGGVPFKGDTAFSVALKHKTKLPQDPKKLNPKLSENLSRLILICMEKERERRYQSAEALLNDLQNIEDGLPLGTKIRPRRETFVGALIRKKFLIPAVVAALAIIAVVVWQLFPGKGISAPKIENSIAVISFENLTGDEAHDMLQRAIPSLLITNLENTGLLHVATWERLRDLMKQVGKEDQETIDKDLGFELCRREGIESIALGKVMKVGDVFATDVKVFDVATKELIKSASSQGEGVNSIINTQIGELSREIALGIGITRQEIASADLNIFEYTTSSMEAYNYFIKGREDWYNQYSKEAVTRLEKAVELDPNFAVAYLYLGYIYNKLVIDLNKKRENINKAKTLSDTMPLSEKEKLMIDAEYALHIEQNYERRLEILNTIVAKYPRDKWVHLELSKYYREREMYSEVKKHSEIVLALDPSWGDAYEELAFAHANTGDNEKALEYLQKYSAAVPGDPSANLTTGHFYVKMGRIDEAIRKFKDAVDIKPDFQVGHYLAYAYAMKEDYAETFRWMDKFITNAPSEGSKVFTGYALKGFCHYLLGNSKQSLEDLQTGWGIYNERSAGGPGPGVVAYMIPLVNYERGEFDLCRDRFQRWHDGGMENLPKEAEDQRSYVSFWLHCPLGAMDLKQGNLDSARSHLKQLEALMPKMTSPQKWEGYHWLLGQILIAEGSYDEAISVLKDAPRMKMPWLWNTQSVITYNLFNIDSFLAQAYKEKGDFDKAIEVYERLIDPDSENRDGRLIRPENYYYLGELYEKKGRKAKAVASYEKFLTLYEDADLRIAELENARKRLAGLKSHRTIWREMVSLLSDAEVSERRLTI